MDIRNDLIQMLTNYRDECCGGNADRAAASLGVSAPTFSRWINGVHIPKMETLIPVFEQLGARIVLPNQEPAKDVCFVDARIAPAGEMQERPNAEDYIAVPLVEEVGAGPGYIPQGELRSWFLVYKHQSAVRYRRDLIAVEIAKHSTSMLPTLHPGDIVLVDRQDRDVTRAGHMMLVMDSDGAGKVKRVSVEPLKDDFRIMYYSDNALDNPPEVYSLREDFNDNWDNCIVGRVVWAWGDVSNK